ncbi:MAG: two-component sensor histidine kinase [Comamonadaceae bacterium]|nr:two-component sensor histidine kinase [Comamonadaceae bacterium]
MDKAWHGRTATALAACMVACAGAWWLAHARLQQVQADFETDARIIHRLLSQRAVQHDAVLATLALLQPRADAGADAALERLPALYPQITAVLRRSDDTPWPAAERTPLDAAEARSRALHRAELAAPELAAGRYSVVLASPQGSHALQIDLRAAVPWNEWPMDPATSPVRVALEHAGHAYVVQPGRPQSRGWRFDFRKRLASASQPLDVVAERGVGWAELPWWRMLLWCALVAAAWTAGQALWRQRIARRRAEELLRLGQVARLNTLGELAAGMAHELNQPLTAVLANTQAAGRLLTEAPPELDMARMAMDRAVEQARRAANTVGRLRRLVERPAQGQPPKPLLLDDAVRDALHLLEPECRKAGVLPQLQAPAEALTVLADPVALQQILYNLLMNALQALALVPPAERRLLLRLAPTGDAAHVQLHIEDSGPGVPAEVLAHLFEPFTTTRQGGLGLGLTLCDSLAQAMGAQLACAPRQGRGACFVLTMAAA